MIVVQIFKIIIDLNNITNNEIIIIITIIIMQILIFQSPNKINNPIYIKIINNYKINNNNLFNNFLHKQVLNNSRKKINYNCFNNLRINSSFNSRGINRSFH